MPCIIARTATYWITKLHKAQSACFAHVQNRVSMTLHDAFLIFLVGLSTAICSEASTLNVVGLKNIKELCKVPSQGTSQVKIKYSIGVATCFYSSYSFGSITFLAHRLQADLLVRGRHFKVNHFVFLPLPRRCIQLHARAK